MSLSVGIVGLPNVGKSTLFNALLKRQAALVADYPFTTIEPNVGTVPVEDERVSKLGRIVEEESKAAPKVVQATVKFVDIAGLVAGAHKGEGLGNQFLGHIRGCNLICHVLRGFENSGVVKAGSVSPIDDLKTVRTELILKDLEAVGKIKNEKLKIKNYNSKFKIVLEKIGATLNKGGMLNKLDFSEEEENLIRDLFLLTIKPEIFVLNVDEDKLGKINEGDSIFLFQHPTSPMQHQGSSPHLRGGRIGEDKIEIKKEDIVVLSAKLESELGSLSEKDQQLYLKELGAKESVLEKLVKRAYKKLGLISFFTTTGGHEVRAWTIKKGSSAIEAAGIIHSDFAERFIKAKVITTDDFIKAGGWTKAKELGKIRFEGRDYKIKEGEVVEFVIGN